MTKVCTNCKRDLNINEFSLNKDAKDGLQYQCKYCQKEYHENNKKHNKEYQKEYGINNKDKKSEYMKEYYINNKNRVKKYHEDYSKNNKIKLSTFNKMRRLCKCLYKTYSIQLSIDELPISDSEGYLQVKCTYCGKYFYPTILQVQNRIQALSGQVGGECRLYCSENCKQACPVYRKKTITPGLEEATSREVQPQLRQLVLARDEYQCVKCGVTTDDAELHCHHIDPAKRNPIESADVDNCTTLCIDCHHEVHRYSWCKIKC